MAASDLAIEVLDVGMNFPRNCRGRRKIKDIFAALSRRGRPEEFWPLRDLGPMFGRGNRSGWWDATAKAIHL